MLRDDTYTYFAYFLSFFTYIDAHFYEKPLKFGTAYILTIFIKNIVKIWNNVGVVEELSR